ncbi:hypothetical protein GGH96_003226 [Coemansia sp. RSA 1972]|nr:hypothetical protein GGH96_003226 [Coemansia sp. RSA 1972]
MIAIGQMWNRWAKSRPLVTLSLTNGTMGAIGDVIAQNIAQPTAQQTGKTKSTGGCSQAIGYDPMRTARFFLYGCMFGPVAYKWYSLLDRRFPLPLVALGSPAPSALGTSAAKMLAIGKRVAVDQVAFAPVAIGTFFAVMGAMEGKHINDIRASLRAKYPDALVGNYALWPWAQLVNFSVIPLIYRVPFSSVVSVLWNVYLSWINSRRSSGVPINSV